MNTYEGKQRGLSEVSCVYSCRVCILRLPTFVNICIVTYVCKHVYNCILSHRTAEWSRSKLSLTQTN